MKRINSYITVLTILSFVTILFFNIKNKTIEKNDNSYSLRLIEKKNFWIYEIYNNDTLFISQEYIPAVKGKQVFKTKEDAEKIGNLVINKLLKNRFPVISKNDLNNNNIYFEII